MGESVCSVCGDASGGCQHIKGQRYQEILCFRELREPLDAYEWSFVAVPAQRRAGILKRFGRNPEGELLKQAALGRKYLQELRRETLRLALLAGDGLDGEAFRKALGQLDEEALSGLRDAFRRRAALRFPAAPQLAAPAVPLTENTEDFLV